MGIEGVLEEGFVTTSADKLINWARTSVISGTTLIHLELSCETL
jgi:NADH:ubiquinone oxidoreductase subunit B-like Fe-S oxidoreductase